MDLCISPDQNLWLGSLPHVFLQNGSACSYWEPHLAHGTGGFPDPMCLRWALFNVLICWFFFLNVLEHSGKLFLVSLPSFHSSD